MRVFADRNTGLEQFSGENISIISMGAPDNEVSPILFTVPLQMLAYHTALIKGADIDQPRNLAKSVTVEWVNYRLMASGSNTAQFSQVGDGGVGGETG